MTNNTLLLKVRRQVQKSGNNFFEMLGDADDDLQDIAGEFMSMNEEYVLNHQGINETARTLDILKRGYSKNQLRLLSRMRETMLAERGICDAEAQTGDVTSPIDPSLSCEENIKNLKKQEFLVAAKTVPKRFNECDNSETPEASDAILESKEDPDEKMECECGNDTFRLYFEHVIDDANVYCTNCGRLL